MVNDELGKDINGVGDIEEDGVVVSFGEIIVLEEDIGVGIDVGVGVFGFVVFGKNFGGDFVDLVDEFEYGVFRYVFLGEFVLGRVVGVGFVEDGVVVIGDDMVGVEGVLEVFGDVFIGDIIINDFFYFGELVEYFLVGEVVEGIGKIVEIGSEG